MAVDEALLAGIKVLDLGRHPSAALASVVLADFGAQVACGAVPAVTGHPAAPMLLRGKRVLEAARSGRHGDECEPALKEADVVVTTLGPDDAAPALRPEQIHLNISGWGLQGPYARWPMSEGLVAAKSGRMASFEGQNPRPGPVYSAVQVATFAAAQIAVQGVLAALMERRRTGRGQRVETSLLQALMPYDTSGFTRAQLEPRYPQYLPPEPVSEKLPRINYQPLQARDGRWIQQGNLLDHLFKSFLAEIGLTGLVPEAERGKQGTAWSHDTTEMMRKAIMRRIRERTAAEWIADFKKNGNIAVAAYQTTQEALDDPDFLVSGAIVDAEHPRLGKLRWLGPAAHLEATPASISVLPRAAAPARPPAAGAAATGQGLLAGVTVLEFASIIATPMGVSMLGDLGARIIKVEPIGGDPGRRTTGNMAAGLGAVKFNVGKDSICIELKSPKGREILDKLLPKADLIAHNFRPGVPDKLGFGYERARRFNPKVVWLSANGFGPTAPSADSPCSHPIAGALAGGAVYQAGGGMPPPATDDIDALLEGARRMMRANEVNPDPNTSMIVATAAMLGLYAARRFGIGQRINVDMMLANAWANFDDALRYAGKPPRAAVDSGGFGLHALYRLYPCARGWVFLAVADEDFGSLCAALGLPSLAGEARFKDAVSRRAHDGALAEQLGAALRQADADAWEARLSALGCVRADGPVAGEFWLPDPHVRANGFVRATPHRRYGEIYRHAPLMSFSAAPMRCGPGTLAGEHTDAVLAELGYDAAAIAALRAEGVVWSEAVTVEEAFGAAR